MSNHETITADNMRGIYTFYLTLPVAISFTTWRPKHCWNWFPYQNDGRSLEMSWSSKKTEGQNLWACIYVCVCVCVRAFVCVVQSTRISTVMNGQIRGECQRRKEIKREGEGTIEKRVGFLGPFLFPGLCFWSTLFAFSNNCKGK